ncbi:hypothetical protein [Acidithiobacillus sp. AMEEHan]|uniref:hypothetical protein n=1 Tax=Acidithiobacillus sp. AMEEHan TaxID=2994951 RepID=UPI0027E47C3E|nr:hypothetical protein [Acidithiobacillus sp. AMEEHan]
MKKSALSLSSLLLFLLTGCAINNQPALTQPGQTDNIAKKNIDSYASQLSEIVAGRVRFIRIKEENEEIKKHGYPIPVPGGICRAVITVLPSGELVHLQLAQCDSEALGKIERQAIVESSPFPPTPYGKEVTVTIGTYANEPTPGVDGE